MISFNTNLLLCSLNQDCAEYSDARAFFASLPTAPRAVAICELFWSNFTSCSAIPPYLRTRSIRLTPSPSFRPSASIRPGSSLIIRATSPA